MIEFPLQNSRTHTKLVYGLLHAVQLDVEARIGICLGHDGNSNDSSGARRLPDEAVLGNALDFSFSLLQ